MRNKTRFQKGSGCYTCQSCARRTRSTGRGDNEFSKLCAECYDLAGIENAISDGSDPEDYAVEISDLLQIISKRGGNTEGFSDLFKYVAKVT